MRVLIAPDTFAGHLDAQQAADAIAAGWAEQAPSDQLTTTPLSDGGPGLVDVVLSARGGELVPVTVSGPLGEPVPAAVLVVTETDGSRTAYLEASQACGLHLLAPERRDAWRATSTGVGELVQAAVQTGATRVVIGIGDSASHDGGAGILAALGAGPAELLGGGGGALADLTADALSGLDAVRQRLRGVQLVAATSSDLPLLGFHGASATDAERRGATPEQAQQLEAALGHFAHVAQRSQVAGRSLGGSGMAGVAGAGAGGGIGFALLLLGATRVDGVQEVLAATGFAQRLSGADLVVTGESVFGWHSMRGGVVASVAESALAVGLPVVVLAVEVEVGRRETLNLGVSGAYAVADRQGWLADVQRDPAGALARRARRVARTWSR
ncbi:glycerate kinase family protein [Angustibacter luteus]|uniref:Glycerate kinase n=1 Tax=Angustibacter luteus TaxID=658456 RepID=A0ABW1JC27_9ACTN